MNIYSTLDFIRRNLAWVITGFVVLGLVIFIAGRSMINVSLGSDSANLGDVELKLLDSSGEVIREDSLPTDSSSQRWFVPNGDYSVSATTDSGAAISAVVARGWLRTSQVELDIKPPLGRDVVAENASSCVVGGESLIISWLCDSLYSRAQAHLPATADTAAYTTTLSGPGLWQIHDITNLQGEMWALIELIVFEGEEDDDHGSSGPPFRLFKVDSTTGEITDDPPVQLSGLDAELTYRSYTSDSDNSVYVYATDGSYVARLSQSADDQPSLSTVNTPLDELQRDNLGVFAINSLSADAGEVVLLDPQAYEGGAGIDSPVIAGEDLDEEYLSNLPTGTLLSWADGQQRSYELPAGVVSASTCGEYLCTVQDDQLVVHDSSSDNPQEIGRMAGAGVNELIRHDNQLYAATDSGLLQLSSFEPVAGNVVVDPPNDQPLCGAGRSGNQLLVCVQVDGRSLLTVVNPDSQRRSDVVLANLTASDAIDSVSINRQFIHLTPVADGWGYTDDGRYLPDLRALQATNSEINQLAAELNLGELGYQLVNIYQELGQ